MISLHIYVHWCVILFRANLCFVHNFFRTADDRVELEIVHEISVF